MVIKVFVAMVVDNGFQLRMAIITVVKTVCGTSASNVGKNLMMDDQALSLKCDKTRLSTKWSSNCYKMKSSYSEPSETTK